jgi:serine/threonine protein kinase/formylglycine-generating enzyme required for sulfatase activity
MTAGSGGSGPHPSGGGGDGIVFEPGTPLDGGRYILDRELGRGGFGTVYLAREVRPLNRLVVIKLPHPSLLQQPGFVDRFQAEIGHLASLEHACIVKIYGAGVEQSLPYAVVQYLPGGDLGNRLHSGAGTVPPHRILEWLPGIAGALDYMHQQGVLHRDIKPDNILFDAQGQAYLSDFGISKAMTDSQDASQVRTQTGMFVGAPAYVAPEYVDRKFTAACDQYSLAVVVYEALSGRRPHEADTAERLIIKKATEPPAHLGDRVIGLAPALVDTVMRGLSTEPEDRFDSCTEFARAFAAGLPGSVAIPRVTDATAPGISTPASAASTLPTERSPGRGGRAWLLVLLLLLLLPLGWWLAQDAHVSGFIEGLSATAQPEPTPIAESEPIADAPVIPGPPIREPENAASDRQPVAPPPERVAERAAPELEAPPTRALPKPAQLTIESPAPGARVFVNGRDMGAAGAALTVPAGDVQLRVEAPGHEPYTQELALEAGERSRSRITLKEIPPTVTIRSNVSGDRLFIDGVAVGSTGKKKHPLTPGKAVTIRVEKPGYEAWQERVTLEPGASRTLRAALSPKPQEGMALVAAGPAVFGCNPTTDRACYGDEVRADLSALPDFLIDRTEVRVNDYERCVAAGACTAEQLELEFWDGRTRRSRADTCNWKKAGRGSHPINCVNWNQAVSYCKWLDRRLPSESEWEKAARGRDGDKYPWGNVEYSSADKVANIADESAQQKQPMWIVADKYDDGHAATAPVGSFPNGVSPYGALDMIGNVWEWTADAYDEAGELRAARGGSFSDVPRTSRASNRFALAPDVRIGTGGFRCAR